MQSYDIGNRIYELRKEKGLSQKELGALIGVSNKAVSKWETGAAAPKTETMIALAAVLGITVEELLSGKQPEAEDIYTLDALSAKTANMLLKNKIKDYEQLKSDEKYKKAKTYLVCILCLFITVTVLFSVIAVIGNSYAPFFNVEIEEGMSVAECIVSSMEMGCVICGVFTGIILFVRFVKKIPVWFIVLLCIVFPITFLVIQLVGFVMLLPEIILSIRILYEKGKNKNE